MAIATLGIPLPQSELKDTSEPYPCMNCGCGCANADMCWRECCCFSTEQKLAWAKENGVRPPAFLVTQASNRACSRNEMSEKSCSTKQDKEVDTELAQLKPCCRARALAARKANQSSCCQQPSEAKKSVRLPGFIAIHALKCRGHSLSVSLLPPSIRVSTLVSAHLLDGNGMLSWPTKYLYDSPSYELVNPPPELSDA